MLHCVETKKANPDEEKPTVDLMMMMRSLVMIVMTTTSSNVRLCRASKLRLKRTMKRKRQTLQNLN